MTSPRDPDALLAAYLDEGMTVLPDRVVESVLGEVHRTRQRVVIGPWRARFMVRAVFSTATAVAVLVVGAALLSQRGKSDVAAPTATVGASGSPSQPAVVTVTPTPTAEVLSLDLTWTEVDIEAGPGGVAWLGDRFAMVDSSGAIRTSTDGMSWEVLQPGDPDPGYADLLKERASLVTWEDQIVGWSNPQDGPDVAGKPPITARDELRIVQPPALPTVTTPFEGRIQWVGVGPAGIVAQANFDRGRTIDIVGWFSPDGIEWTAIPTIGSPSPAGGPWFPFGFQDVVGVSDGFIARGGVEGDDTCPLPDGCSTSMWYSSDGLAWRNLGGHLGPEQPGAWSGSLVPWKGGALLTDGDGRFDLWTSQGYRELPMAAGFPAPSGDIALPPVTGPLGLVSIRVDPMEVLITRDGIDWKLDPMPAAMVPAGRRTTVAVGDRSVLYLTWSGSSEEGYVPSLWVGSVEP